MKEELECGEHDGPYNPERRNSIYFSVVELAIREARRSSSNFRIGAVVTDRRWGVLSTGHNIRKTHPLQARFTKSDKVPYLHAEIHAIARLAGRIHRSQERPYRIVVVRILASGELALASPCPQTCRPMIEEVGIRRIYYSDSRGRMVEEEGSYGG